MIRFSHRHPGLEPGSNRVLSMVVGNEGQRVVDVGCRLKAGMTGWAEMADAR